MGRQKRIKEDEMRVGYMPDKREPVQIPTYKTGGTTIDYLSRLGDPSTRKRGLSAYQDTKRRRNYQYKVRYQTWPQPDINGLGALFKPVIPGAPEGEGTTFLKKMLNKAMGGKKIEAGTKVKLSADQVKISDNRTSLSKLKTYGFIIVSTLIVGGVIYWIYPKNQRFKGKEQAAQNRLEKRNEIQKLYDEGKIDAKERDKRFKFADIEYDEQISAIDKDAEKPSGMFDFLLYSLVGVGVYFALIQSNILQSAGSGAHSLATRSWPKKYTV